LAITRDEVAYIAHLARISLSERELDEMAPQLDAIVTAVARVTQVMGTGLSPQRDRPLSNALRSDVVRPSLPLSSILQSAPASEDGRFAVPRILGDDT